MKVGIGLPSTIPGARSDVIVEWAVKADAGPFTSLGVLDRIVYPNYEALITLAAAAAVTRRVRLMTTVLLAPVRNAAILAKQAASIDALSGGRLTLGLGVGGREDDFQAVGVAFHERGRLFDAELATMHQIWSGQPAVPGTGKIGPAPAQSGGPEVLIGGYTPAAIQRVGRWGSGFIAGGTDPARALRLYTSAEDAWKAASRPGTPRFVACLYYGLGPDANERAGVYIRDYYASMGPRVDQMARSIPSTAAAVKDAIQGFIDIGADEVVCWPCIPELDQVERLAELVR